MTAIPKAKSIHNARDSPHSREQRLTIAIGRPNELPKLRYWWASISETRMDLEICPISQSSFAIKAPAIAEWQWMQRPSLKNIWRAAGGDPDFEAGVDRLAVGLRRAMRSPRAGKNPPGYSRAIIEIWEGGQGSGREITGGRTEQHSRHRRFLRHSGVPKSFF